MPYIDVRRLWSYLHFFKIPVSEAPHKKCSFNFDIFQTKSNPLPQEFWNFWANFPWADFWFGNVVALFVSYFFKNQGESDLKHWIWSTPRFSTQNFKIVGAQKVPQNFWIALTPLPHPSPYGKYPN